MFDRSTGEVSESTVILARLDAVRYRGYSKLRTRTAPRVALCP